MKILKQFTKWLSKTGSETKNPTNSRYSDYNPGKDLYKQSDQNEKYKRWSKTIATYNSTITSLSSSNTSPVNPAQGSILVINGNTNKVEVKTALEVGGRDVIKELDEMRDALLLLKRDINMEAKYPRLKELKDEYERELAKYKTFDTLKESK